MPTGHIELQRIRPFAADNMAMITSEIAATDVDAQPASAFDTTLFHQVIPVVLSEPETSE